MLIIQLFAVGSSSLETWLLETKCPKMMFGNWSDQIFSCKFYFTGGVMIKYQIALFMHPVLKSDYLLKCHYHYELTQICVNRQLLKVDDVKTVDYASMVLHTCLDEAKVEELSQSQNIQVALRVMELCKTHHDLDWM